MISKRLKQIAATLLAALSIIGSHCLHAAANPPAEAQRPSNPVITDAWPASWKADLASAASQLIKSKAAPEKVSGILTLVFLDKPAERQSIEKMLPTAVASYPKAKLIRATPEQLQTLDRLGASYRTFPQPRRIGHQLFPFNSATETVIFPASIPKTVAPSGGRKLHFVQFAGPVQDAWLEAVSADGATRLTSYPEFAYVVWASDAEITRLQKRAFVVWTGEYGPGFKLSHELAASLLIPGKASLPGDQSIELIVCAVLADSSNERIFQELEARGAKVDLRAKLDIYESARVTTTVREIAPLIARSGILSVEVFHPPQAEDEVSAQIVAGNYNGSGVPATGYPAWLSGLGINGTGVTVGVVDDGVNDTHADLNGRVTSLNYGANSAGLGHGHHVAGIVGGNAAIGTTDANSFRYGQGMAPAANIIDQPFLVSGSSRTYQQLCRDTVTTAGQNGVTGYVQNNSWGSGTGSAPGTNTTYQSTEREYDLYVRDADNVAAGNQGLVVCFSAGNDGDSNGCPAPAQTLTRPKTAKNIITTGATNNYRTAQGTYSNNIQDLASFSSRGPANDGRIKPEILMPGTYISSARTNSYVAWGAIDANYVFVGGTSQASPHTAGSAALLTQWWQNSHAGVRPTPAMVKALLITSAVEISNAGDTIGGCSSVEATTTPIPNQNEGWGRANLINVLQPPAPVETVDRTTPLANTGDIYSFSGQVSNSTKSVRVTLTWTDSAGAIGANPALVNNLDLEVTVGGNTYRGNVLSSGISTTGGSADTVNNTECVILPAGLSGPLNVTVRATTLAGDGVPGDADVTDQDFALVITNSVLFGPPTVTTPTNASITPTSATLGGNVTSDGGVAITERGVVYSLTSANADPLIGGAGVTKLTSAGTTGIFTVNATGLTTGAGYSFKAYATNSFGTTYTTPVSTFTQGAPVVTTPTSASITSSSATLGGNATNDAGSAITERGVVYSITSVNPNPLIGGAGVTKLTTAGTTGIFTVNATSLTQATGYSFKAYATNGVGTTYTSPVSTFSTLANAPTVTTPTQTAITTSSATLGGNVTSDGGSTIMERGVVYSTTSVNSNPLIGGAGVTKVTGAGTTGVFTVNVTGLTQNTGYSFKAYATNSVGTTYTSPVSTFTTLVAVPLTGTKTLGTGGNYTSLTNAGGLFEAINNNGVNGAVSVQVTTDLNAETGTVALNALTGTTPSLKIFPSGAARTISGTFAGALIRLNGADNVTFDGSLGGTGTDRSLTITNTSTTSPTVISLISLGTGLGATNNVIKNSNISTGVATTTGYGISVGGSTPGTTGADNDNVTIQNNSITAAPIGIYASGTSSAATGGDDNLQILGNSIAYNSTLSSLGIRVGNALNSAVSQNTVSEQTTSSSASTAISIETGFVSSSVTRNTVTKSLTTDSGGWGSRGITVGTGTTTSALTIANNIIYGVNGSNWSSFGGSSSMGIVIGTIGNSSTLTTTTGGINLYYNSVNMTGSMGTGSSTARTAALYVGSSASALDMRNNVFVNTQVATSATQKNYAIYSAATSAAFATIDYNDYFVSNTFNAASAIPGFLTSDRVDLAGVQAGFGQNTHSFIGDPLFTSATDLHVTSLASPVSNVGTPIAGVLVDFDGGPRSATTPDVGADEFGGSNLPTISTPTQTAVTANTATLGGNVTGDGGTAITERGVVYSITSINSDPLIGGTGVTKVTSAGTTGVFTLNATGLTQGTAYSFKAYATNSTGTIYTTPVSSFTTLTAQEAWRQTYFGITTNTGDAADTADPDGDGGNNFFEWVAGLIPNNAASRFKVRVEGVLGQPTQKAIIFSPLISGRTYVVKSKASLSDVTWTALASFTTNDNVPLQERTVTDLAAGTGPKFYQVEITLP